MLTGYFLHEAYPSSVMAQPLAPHDLVTLEELTLSNMWEVAALIEVLERKGILPKGTDQ